MKFKPILVILTLIFLISNASAIAIVGNTGGIVIEPSKSLVKFIWLANYDVNGTSLIPYSNGFSLDGLTVIAYADGSAKCFIYEWDVVSGVVEFSIVVPENTNIDFTFKGFEPNSKCVIYKNGEKYLTIDTDEFGKVELKESIPSGETCYKIVCYGGVRPTPSPTTPPTTVKPPIETPPVQQLPFTPGFEAIFAIAGLISVGYLLKRKR